MGIVVSVVIVSRDKKDLLARAIDSVAAQTLEKSKYELIVVDDGSEKDDLAALVAEKRKKFRNIRVVRQGQLSLAAGRNAGARNSIAKIIAFTDNDCIADKEWLKGLLEKLGNPSVIGVEGMIYTDSPRALFTNAPENLHGGKFTGANSAYLREIIGKAGWYDEGMRFWREDSEFAFRAMRFGKIAFAENAIVYHPQRKDPPHAVFRYLFLLRNEWICLARHPAEYLKSIGPAFAKDIAKSAITYAFFTLCIMALLAGDFIGLAMWAAGRLALGAGLLLLQAGTGKLEKNSRISEAALYIVLGSAKDIAYPLFFAYGFFDSLRFLKVGK